MSNGIGRFVLQSASNRRIDIEFDLRGNSLCNLYLVANRGSAVEERFYISSFDDDYGLWDESAFLLLAQRFLLKVD